MSYQNLNVKSGELFCFSEGDYSDYGYIGHFKALIDITPDMMNMVKNSVNPKPYGEKSSRFVAELVRRQWIEQIDVREIHVGSYGELDLS